MVIGISAATDELLEQNVKRAMTVIRKQSCNAEAPAYMQVDALTTELPIGRRMIPMRRTLTTGGAAIIVPFTTQELFVPGGNWYGVNAQSSNARSRPYDDRQRQRLHPRHVGFGQVAVSQDGDRERTHRPAR